MRASRRMVQRTAVIDALWSALRDAPSALLRTRFGLARTRDESVRTQGTGGGAGTHILIMTRFLVFVNEIPSLSLIRAVFPLPRTVRNDQPPWTRLQRQRSRLYVALSRLRLAFRLPFARLSRHKAALKDAPFHTIRQGPRQARCA
jgi:hypothetical protein